MIEPLALVPYDNRTSFTTLTVMASALNSLRNLSQLTWTKGVYGWHLDMQFTLDNIRPELAEFWLENGLGRLIRLVALGETLWEGMTYIVQAELPGTTLTRTMEEMANTVYVEYSDNDTGKQMVTTASIDSASAAMYGTKEVYLPGGTCSSTKATNLATRYLATHKDPPIAREVNDRRQGTAAVRVTAYGYYRTLTWRYYTSTTAGTQASATTIGDIATSKGAFLSTTQNLAATGRTLPRRFGERQDAWQQMMSLVSEGTSNDRRYFLGVKAGRILTGWEEPITASYQKSVSIPGQFCDIAAGMPLPYWYIQPGKWLRMAMAKSESETVARANPRFMIMGSCQYDGVARTVTPSYGVTVQESRPSAKKETADDNPFARPWTHWEWEHGMRAYFYQGRWQVQYRHPYSRTIPPPTT